MSESFAEANATLMGGGSTTAARFTTVGDTFSGSVVSVVVYQEKEFNKQTRRPDGPLKFYPSGDPIMSVAAEIATSLRDDADDDGRRKIYIQGKRMKTAVREAVSAAGAKGLEAGGQLSVTFTGVDAQTEARCYSATYTPPTGLGEAPPAAPAAPVAPVAPAAPADGPTAEQIAALKAAGVDPATVFPGYVG